MTRTDTRQRLLDAAIHLVARGGMRAMSHRAVETAAGAARGSTTYHLGTRHQMIEAVLGRLADLDVAAMQQELHRVSMDHLTTGTLDLETTVRGTVTALLGDRDRLLARYCLMVEAARDESLQPMLRRWREAFDQLPEPMLARLGAPEPAGAARDLVALLDGMIFAHLSTGREDELPDRAVRTLADFIRRRTGRPLP